MPTIPQGTLDLLILQTLARRPRHGYAIARWIEEATDDVLAVQEGALYPALGRLQERGWIRAKWTRSELNKDVKTYELTVKGHAELERRTLNWQALAGAVAKLIKAR
jgi:PadR family transcriptional regulator, regulatory protein PadR